MKKVVVSFILIVFLISCQSEPDIVIIPDYNISVDDGVKKLSHTPTGIVYVEPANMTVKIDFSCDEYMTSHIKEYGEFLMDTVRTVGKLVSTYKTLIPSFEYGWSSHIFPYTDGDYVFPKLEYMLAQECFRDDCGSQTRKAILQIVIDKQKSKFREYEDSYTTRQTGIFLMAVILVKENDTTFIKAAQENPDLQNALILNQNIRTDKEFSNIMIQYAEKYLYTK